MKRILEVSTIDMQWQVQVLGTRNVLPIWGREPGELLCKEVRWRRVFESDIKSSRFGLPKSGVFEIEFEIILTPKQWEGVDDKYVPFPKFDWTPIEKARLTL